MDLTQVKAELGAFFRKDERAVMAVVYGKDVELNAFAKSVTRVKGRYPALHGAVGHVVQGFAASWNEIGSVVFRVNELVAYHQKVNFPIIPHEVEGSWLALMVEEGKTLKDMPISQFIWKNLLVPKVLDDVNDLSGNGVYNAGALATYGNSMNGIKKILIDGVANTNNPMIRIPLTALTASNIVDQVTIFEKKIPSSLKKHIKTIFMSETNAENYRLDYEDTFGANTNYVEGKGMKSRLGARKIVGLSCLNGSDVIFATIEGNLLKLIDLNDAPTVTDVQTLDYKVKIFMEWWLGYGFYVNQLVLVSNYADAVYGLGDDDLNTLYYPLDAAAMNATNTP